MIIMCFIHKLMDLFEICGFGFLRPLFSYNALFEGTAIFISIQNHSVYYRMH